MIDFNKIEVSEKEKNILNILDEIAKAAEISTSEIAKATGLSYPTISRVLKILKSKGMVLKTGEEETNIGRRPEKVSLNKGFGCLIHLMIKENAIIGYLSDLKGEIIYKTHKNFLGKITLNSLLENILAVYQSLTGSGRVQNRKFMAVSVSIPGIVNEQERKVFRLPSAFGFREASLFDDIQGLLKVPVIIYNSSMLMAMGQYIKGSASPENLVFINSDESFGIGAGIVMEGKLLRGANNFAGEIGYIYYSPENFNDTASDAIGMLEKAAGLRSLYERITEMYLTGQSRTLNSLVPDSKEINISVIEKAARMGDREVERVLDEILKIWAIAIINIYLTINPQTVVIGGAVSSENTYILDKLESLVIKALFFKPHIILNDLGELAEVIGGLHLLMNFVFNTIILNEAIKEE
jgi:predicted NBD/HSP70 family sugar kinase